MWNKILNTLQITGLNVLISKAYVLVGLHLSRFSQKRTNLMRTALGVALLSLAVGLALGHWVHLSDAVVAPIALGCSIVGYICVRTGSPDRDDW